MKEFKLYWLGDEDISGETIKGETFSDAWIKAGYTERAFDALAWWEEVS